VAPHPFGYRRRARGVDAGWSVGRSGRAARRHRTTQGTLSAIAQGAKSGGAWKIMQPYLEALTSNG